VEKFCNEKRTEFNFRRRRRKTVFPPGEDLVVAVHRLYYIHKWQTFQPKPTCIAR
jgi:hypothetical protein